MSGDWRTHIRWVVAHPTEPKVLLARRDGSQRLPEVERPGPVWTGDPGQLLPGLRDLLGTDAVLLRCLEEHEDAAARAQRATLLAVPRALPALAEGLAWAGRAGRPAPPGWSHWSTRSAPQWVMWRWPPTSITRAGWASPTRWLRSRQV